MLKNPSSIMLAVFFAGLLIGSIRLIQWKWAVPARGYAQLSLLVISEIAFFCNKGVTCANCPLSFGICPVGTLQRAAFIPSFPLYSTLFIIGVTGYIFGTLTCGWACPVGFVQDLFSAVSPKKKKIRVPDRLRLGRYFVLAVLVVLVFVELRLHYFSSRGIYVLNEAVIFGGFILAAAAFVSKRAFCKTLCPLGLVYGLFNKVSLVRVRLRKCLNCKVCLDRCVADIDPSAQVNKDWCVKCYNCQKVCDDVHKVS